MDAPFETDDSEIEVPLASTLLIVDDEPVVRDVLTRLLSRETDLHVLEADTAEAGLKLLGQRRVDLLVTDKNLPAMGGVELIREAKRRAPGLEAVMITGYASADSLVAAFAAGASDYLLKPFDDLQVVKAKLRAGIDRRADRIRARARARSLAGEAQSLLAGGKHAAARAWQELDACFQAHDAFIRGAAAGEVRVLDAPEAIDVLVRANLLATAAEEDVAARGDVVVLSTRRPDWREVAERLLAGQPEVLLLAHPEAELSDLLDALALRLELIGFGSGSTELLPARARAALLRRGLARAQERLVAALGQFRSALTG